MNTICNKCRYLWQRLGMNYCTSINNCKYSKNKKQCPHFEQGNNIKTHLGKSNGWWKKGNK